MAQRVSSSRFVGRERELAELRRALSSADELPAVYFVAGESGVGKTRLLRELAAAAEADGARALGGSCIELGGDELPYAPLVAALRPLHRTCEPALDSLSQSTRAQLARLSPEIGEPSDEGERERGEAQRRLFDAFLELIAVLGEERPVVLWIEDIHWADSSTRAFLRFLAASLSGERVLVVATYRGDELHRRHPLRPLLAELERSPRARRIELERFDRGELTDQLTDIVGEAPASDVVERLFSRSEGNPLFTEELLAAGIDGRGSLPPSLREALLIRAERLSPEAQALLRLLAVAGRAREGVLAAASGDDGAASISSALREAMDAQIVVLDGDRFGFRHALLREVLHDDLLPGERSELHLRLAAALERVEVESGSAWSATAVAHHYHAAGDQPAALRSAVAAARAVRSLHAYGEAGSLLDRALALWPRVENAAEVAGIDEAGLLAEAARVHYLDDQDAVAEALYERAIEALDLEADPERAANMLSRLAACQWTLGRAERSRETQRRGLDLLPAEGNSPARARLLGQRVRFLLLQGRFGAVVETAPEAIEATESLGMDSELAALLNRYGCALFALGREEEGHERMVESIALAERTGQSEDLAIAYTNYADALHVSGQTRRARELVEEGIGRIRDRITSRGGSLRAFRFVRLNLAEMNFELGDWDRVGAELAEAGTAVQGVVLAHARLRRAQLTLARGGEEGVDEALEEAREILRDALEPQYIALMAMLSAEREERRGELDAARRAIDDGLDRIQFCSEDGFRISLVAAAGLTVEAEVAERARDVGDGDRARAALARADRFLALVEAAAEEGAGAVEGALLASARAEHARAGGDDDQALWRAAAGEWRQVERPYPEAIALWRGAQAALSRGDREGARSQLAAACEIARRLGAGWLEGEVEGLATRARLAPLEIPSGDDAAPQSREEEAPFGLTARELQVLELVSVGATNREIGERLYMAEKTASVHVSRILAKLDVRSRTEAAAVAHRHGIGDAVEQRA